MASPASFEESVKQGAALRKSTGDGRDVQALLFRAQQKTRRSGFSQDHPDFLSDASQAMVDHP